MPKLVANTHGASAVKSYVPPAASAVARFAAISSARSLLLWIITHFLVVSLFSRRLEKSHTSASAPASAPAPTTTSPSRVAYPHQRQQRVHHWLSLIMLLSAPSFFGVQQPIYCHAIGYSYARFIGPVSGPEHEIIVHDELNGGTRVDYVARPDYQFAYGVEDSETHVLQNRKETRNGDAVKGVYSLVDPDGVLRVVKYTADDINGFQAEVITDGVATIHGQSDDGGAANWHVTSNDAAHNSQDDADDEDDNDNDHGNEGSKNDYEVYEEDSDHFGNDAEDSDDVKSSEASYEVGEDDGGGYDKSNDDDDDYY